MSIYDRLYRERIIFLGQEIDDEIVNKVVAIMLYSDSEDPTKPMYLYLNSPGGSIISGLTLYDTMRHISSPVATVNIGLAASMVRTIFFLLLCVPNPFLTHLCLPQASFILGAGNRGQRFALPHSRTMIHQPMGGARGQAEDIRIEAELVLQINSELVAMYSQMTGQPVERIRKDMDRDTYMSAQQVVLSPLICH